MILERTNVGLELRREVPAPRARDSRVEVHKFDLMLSKWAPNIELSVSLALTWMFAVSLQQWLNVLLMISKPKTHQSLLILCPHLLRGEAELSGNPRATPSIAHTTEQRHSVSYRRAATQGLCLSPHNPRPPLPLFSPEQFSQVFPLAFYNIFPRGALESTIFSVALHLHAFKAGGSFD